MYSTVKTENIERKKVGQRSGKFLVVTAKKWFDKVNGNTYFTASVMVVYRGEKISFNIPYEYGYGDSYEDAAKRELSFILPAVFKNDGALWRQCQEKGFIYYRTSSYVSTKKEL